MTANKCGTADYTKAGGWADGEAAKKSYCKVSNEHSFYLGKVVNGRVESDRPFKRPCAEEAGPARDSGAGAQKARTTPLAAQVLPTVSPAVPAQQVVYNFSGADLRGANFSGANFGSGSIIMGPTAHVKLQPAKEDTDDEDDASYNCDYDDEDAYGCDGS
mmetsp:Transcript_24012/g.83006  ORF Transcript_24012/g.83006 Transcript_24012/m.83006 type:complete len:160 (-) Transcript_24012:37-516(-)